MTDKQNIIEDKDRVSLIKFSDKGLRRTFSLVQKDQNFFQLKNQIDSLKLDADDDRVGESCGLGISLHRMAFEFTKGTYSSQSNKANTT